MLNDFEIVAVLLGGVIAAVGVLYRQNAKKREALSVALFNLLEIWWILRLFAIDDRKLLKEYLEIIKEISGKLPEEEEKVLEAFFGHPSMLKLVADGLRTQSLGGDGRLADSYENCIARIAPFEPIIAFKLSGRHEIRRQIETISDAPPLEFGEYGEKLNEAIQGALPVVQHTVSKTMLKIVEDDLTDLAWKVGLAEYVSVSMRIRRSRKTVFTKAQRESIKPMLQDLFATAMSRAVGAGLNART